MTLGNIPLAHRNKVDSKILLGYLPSLEYTSTYEKRSTKFRLASLKLFHCVLATVLRPLRNFIDRYAMNDVHIADNDINIRNKNETINSLRNGEAKLISVHHIRNALWK
ncbi:unnamed protein product [Rhizophagus irregularis]|nr:unnamed protein product [Rhizophagus irregularis]